MKALNSNNKCLLASDLKIANTFHTRLLGLMGRKEMKHGEGLLIKKSRNSIHTFFMRFPIDLLFLDANGQVQFVKEKVEPWRMVFALVPVSTDCLELPAGTIEKTSTKVGDTVSVEA